MAIVSWRPREAAGRLAERFAIDPALLQSKAAQEARRRGILAAKAQALRSAEALLGWGRALGWGLIFVSAIHIWETVSIIAPAGVAPLRLPDWVYHGAALLFTLLIDAVALYISRANAVVALAGGAPSRWTAYFYGLTALLNAAFVAGHAPALDPAVRGQILALLNTLFVALLPASIAAGMVAVEGSRRALEVCRLTLTESVATLRELIAPPARDTAGAGGGHQNAPVSVLSAPAAPAEAAPLVGGRPVEFTVEDVVAAFAPDTAGEERLFTPRELRAALGCSEGSAGRLLQAACAAGAVEKAARGAYRVRAGAR